MLWSVVSLICTVTLQTEISLSDSQMISAISFILQSGPRHTTVDQDADQNQFFPQKIANQKDYCSELYWSEVPAMPVYDGPDDDGDGRVCPVLVNLTDFDWNGMAQKKYSDFQFEGIWS